jgi:hypothetical protein
VEDQEVNCPHDSLASLDINPPILVCLDCGLSRWEIGEMLGAGFHRAQMNWVHRDREKMATIRVELAREYVEEPDLQEIAQRLAENHLSNTDEGTVFLYLAGMRIDHLAYAVGKYRRGKLVRWHLNTFATMTRQIPPERRAEIFLEGS